MNFFQSIAGLQVAGDWKINIAQEPTGGFIVSVLFFNESIGDDARKIVPPILLKGTAAELDEGFFATIARPVQETAEMFLNMEQYHRQQQQAKAASQIEKDKKAKADKDKTEKQKKYEDLMKQADALEAEGKYREAWMKVPEVTQYPEHEEAIRTRKSELSKQFAPDLFNK
jgi:PRTRC genetic system protein E